MQTLSLHPLTGEASTTHLTLHNTHLISSFLLFPFQIKVQISKKLGLEDEPTESFGFRRHKHRVGLCHSLPLLPSQEAAFHRLHLLRSSSLTPPSNPSSVTFNLSPPFPSFRRLGFPGVQSHRS